MPVFDPATNCAAPSTSLIVNEPVTCEVPPAAADSATAPLVVPPITAASLVPVTVIVMVRLAVPSSEVTVRVSVAVCPWVSACVALRVLSSW